MNGAIIRARQKELLFDVGASRAVLLLVEVSVYRGSTSGCGHGCRSNLLRHVVSVNSTEGRSDARSDEHEPVDEALMACQAFNDFAELQVPNDHLSILAGTSDKSIAFADVDIGNEIKVAV